MQQQLQQFKDQILNATARSTALRIKLHYAIALWIFDVISKHRSTGIALSRLLLPSPHCKK